MSPLSQENAEQIDLQVGVPVEIYETITTENTREPVVLYLQNPFDGVPWKISWYVDKELVSSGEEATFLPQDQHIGRRLTFKLERGSSLKPESKLMKYSQLAFSVKDLGKLIRAPFRRAAFGGRAFVGLSSQLKYQAPSLISATTKAELENAIAGSKKDLLISAACSLFFLAAFIHINNAGAIAWALPLLALIYFISAVLATLNWHRALRRLNHEEI